ncbi:MAG: AraC family transcriptional regulator [Bacteroides sp.]|nr:AraC family transcriptional regulator [Bacteroides sp.]MCM1085266.1 AraC family transcriptional regulator [Bacteroides sp.]
MDSRIAKLRRLWDGSKTICMLCVKGESTFTMDSTRHRLRENDALIINTGFVLECLSASADFKAVAIVSGNSFLFSSAFSQPIDLYYYIQQKAVLPLAKKSVAQLNDMFTLLCKKMETPKSSSFFQQGIFNSHMVEQLAKTFCYELFDQYSQHIPLRRNGERFGSREMFILRFLNLLDQKVGSERFLNYYAAMLGITPQYLTTILKALTGISANQWVHIVVCEKAKHLMLGQRKNLLLVAKELNYPDQASFCKMFKTQTGFTPIQYKKAF